MSADDYMNRKSPAEAARTRVLENEEPMLVCALEQLAVTHSIRRILIWAMVIVPSVAAGLVLVLSLPGIVR
jgi:hypothetical protein